MSFDITLVISALLVLSYGIEIFAKKVKIPSILMLLMVGILIRIISENLGVKKVEVLMIIPVVGTMGLIFIVFEGGLELFYKKEKKQLISRSFLSALFCFAFTVVFLGIGIQLVSDVEWRTAMINALPISIVSSAIAIPAAQFLQGNKKEFMIYESVFSDIIGIIIFNYLLQYEKFEWGILGNATLEILMITFLCLSFCFIMLLMLKHIKHHLKYVSILASLVLIYSVGKAFHLPSLIVVLVFGLILRNIQIFKFSFVRKYCTYSKFEEDLKSLEQMTQEGVFIIKTFFFILLGYMIDLSSTLSFVNIGLVIFILLIVYGVRWVVLKRINRGSPGHEFYIAPRGLITVLLFFSIPPVLAVSFINIELLLLLVLFNSLVMGFAFLKKPETI